MKRQHKPSEYSYDLFSSCEDMPTQADARQINEDCTQNWRRTGGQTEHARIVSSFRSDKYRGWY